MDEELQKPLRGVLRKREKRPETSAEPTPPVEVPVIRLHDETYVNGQYIETAPLGQEIRNAGQSISPVRGSEQSLPPVNIANITPTYPSKLAASSPVDTPSAVSPPVVSTPDLEEETHFAAEFWVKSEEDTPSKQSPTSNQSSSSAASGMPPVAATPTGKPLTYNPQTTTQARTRSITAQAVKVEQAAAAFTPTDYLDKNLAGSVVYTSVKKSSSRRWLVALCAVVITAGTAVYMIGGGKTPELDLPAFGSGAKNSTSNEAVGSFGTPIQPLVVSAEGRSTAQLDAALFPIGCTSERGSITGYAYVVAASGASANESVALSTGGNVRDCLDDRVAYLHDNKSALRVRIEGYDAERGLIWLRVPAPLPGQPIAVTAQPGERQVGSYTSGASAYVAPSPGIAAPGAPVLVTDGTMVAIYGDTGTPLDLASACGGLLAC